MYLSRRPQLRLTTPPLDQTKAQMMATAFSTSSSTNSSICSSPASYYKVDDMFNTHLPLQCQPTTRPSSTSSSSNIRVLTKRDIKPAALALAQAFEGDAMAEYFTHTPDRSHASKAAQWKLHITIMEHIVKAHIYSGVATTIGDNYDCVALWMPPGTNMDSFRAKILGGMQKWNLGSKLSAEGRFRFFEEFLPKLHDVKHDVLKNQDSNSWYLVYVGTKPQSRGRGYARILIEHKLMEADRDNQICYLESSNIANNAFYHRLGFEDVEPITFDRSDPPVVLDIMIRRPHATAISPATTIIASKLP